MNRFSFPFDQFQRYETIRRIVYSLSDKKEVKILEVGANAHCNLRVFLPEAEIVFSDIDAQDVAEGINFVQADATNLPFSDEEFDFVVSTDVIEHVPKRIREAFICECVRVSKSAFILCCPIDNGLTPTVENDANKTFRNLLGIDYLWLKEHLEQGLPTVESINRIASVHNIPFTRLEHGQLQLWESMTKLHFIKEAEPELRKACRMMDEQYNRSLYLNDVGGSCYRSFWVFGQSSESLQASSLFTNIENQDGRELVVAKEFCSSIESIVRSKLSLGKDLEETRLEHARHNESVNLEIVDLKKRIEEVEGQYNLIINSKSWKITSPVRLMGYIIKGDMYSIKNAIRSRMNENLLLFLGVIKRNASKEKTLQAFNILRKEGILSFISKLRGKFEFEGFSSDMDRQYQAWLATEEIRLDKVADSIEKSMELEETPLISIILPVYNPSQNLLDSCINSVLNQSYSNWELCIVNDASTEPYVEQTLEEFKVRDERIRVKHCAINGHISSASNQAVGMTSGEYILLLDHDDELHPNALMLVYGEIIKNKNVDLIYSDEDHITTDGNRCSPFFKPDWSPHLLYSQNYIGHMVCISRNILLKVDGFTLGLEGAQDYDLLLKVSENTDQIVHIPHILYHWREHPGSTAVNAGSKPYAHEAGIQSLKNHFNRKYLLDNIDVKDGPSLFTYEPQFTVRENTKVSIIIPIRDKVELLQQLIDSIIDKTTWKNYEIIIVDNGSIEKATLYYLDYIQKELNYKVVRDDSDFNWSRVNNVGVEAAEGDLFVFLNNDTIVISEDWLESLVSWAQLPNVAVVGPLLRYEDDTIQHAGVVLGMGGWADHVFKGEEAVHKVGPFVSPVLTRNVLAVTGACQVIERLKFEELGRFDEEFIICGSDVELCIRAYKAGYNNVYLPKAELYHLESKSRSSFVPENDFELSKIKYEPYRTEKVDPFFNPNLDTMQSTPKVKL